MLVILYIIFGSEILRTSIINTLFLFWFCYYILALFYFYYYYQYQSLFSFKEVKIYLFMSNSNRTQSKTPNPKLARYLHRIQQLVGNRGRTPSPLSSRISKPLKPNTLDHYLKYQLTFKIICGFFDKNNKVCMRHFFSMLRTRQNNSKIQKIYKFVPIEKTECAHMIVDSGISTKMLVNLLKTKIKDHMRLGFEAIKSPDLSQSQIVIINTNRSHRSNLVPLSINPKKNFAMGLELKTLYLKSVAYAFGKMKLFEISQIEEQKTTIMRQQLIKKISNGNVKQKYLVSLLQKIFSRRIKQYFSQLNQQHKSKIQEQIIMKKNIDQKLNYFANILFISNKNRIFYEFKSFVKNYQEVQEEEKQKNKLRSLMNSQVKSSGKFNKTRILSDSALKQQAANWLGMIIISLFFRRALYSMRKMERFSWRKVLNSLKLVQILQKRYFFQLQQGIHCINLQNELQKQRNNKNQGINWSAIGTLANMNKFFIKQLAQPYALIKIYSQNKQTKQKILQVMVKNCIKIVNFEVFKRLKDSLRGSKASSIQKVEEEKQLRANTKAKQYLPKVLNKLTVLRKIQVLIKLKNIKKKRSNSVQKSRIKLQWMEDISGFIFQRNRFNKNLIDNYGKIQEIINNDPSFHRNGQYQKSIAQRNGINHNLNNKGINGNNSLTVK